MVAPAYASDTSGLDFQQFVEEFAGKKDFFAALASATLSVAGTAVAVAQLDQAKRSADEAFKASPEGKIQQALAKAMEPFEPSRPQDEVIKRPVMEALRQRIARAGNNMRPSLGVGTSQASLWQQKKPCAGREVLCDSPSEVPIGTG